MSRRGRRRSSWRRKSSSSSKQSVSTYAYQKHSKSNSVNYNDIIEKGETDSFRKEIVLSGSDEEDEKYNEVPSKEKKYKPDDDLNSFQNQSNLIFTEPVGKDKGVKIVTSVTIDDLKKSSPNITFQQSCEPSSEDSTNSTRVITNVTKVKCSGSCFQFEIQEILQLNTSGIKTTFFIQNPEEDGAEACFERKCERILAPDNKSLEKSFQSLNAIYQNQKQDTITHKFSLGETSEQKDAQENSKSSIPSRCCGNLTCRKSCCDNDRDFTLAEWSSRPPSPSYVWSQGKRPSVCKSFSCDQFWDISPPPEFADSQCDTLDDLTEDLASFMFDNCSSGGKQQRGFSPPPSRVYNQDSGCPYSRDEEECADMLAPCFDRLSESDNFELMFMRPSFSVSRSSFTKDFINNHERKTWVRNNSIAIVEHKTCSLPTKRRRTFPGMSEGPSTIQEGLPPYRESFSSGTISPFIMQTLPLQSEGLGRFCQGVERLSPFGIESRKSSHCEARYKPCSGFSNSLFENQPPVNQFYSNKFEEKPEDIFLINEQFREPSHQLVEGLRRPEMDFEENRFEDMAGGEGYNGRDQVEQSEVAESGFDEEIGEVEYQSPGPIAEELTQGDLIIQVIPPSRSGSEEHMLENSSTRSFQNRYTEVMAQQANKDGPDSEQPKHRKSLVQTIMVGESEPRFLQTDSKSLDGCSPEKNLRENLYAASEAPSVSPIVDMEELDSLSTIKVIEEVQPTIQKPIAARTSISSPAHSQIIEETKDPQLERGRRGAEDSDRSATAALSLVNGSTGQEMESHRKEQYHKMDKEEKQSVPKFSLEVKEHLKPSIHKDPDSGGSDHWAKRRKLFKESKQWSSTGGSSITSDVTEESVSENTPSMDVMVRSIEDRGFYTETFHSAAWIYRGDDISSSDSPSSLSPHPRTVSIRERTVKISKGMGEYPWGFRIQFSKPIVVTEVDTNGAAEEAGLMVGDYVLAVNGTDVTSVPHSEAADLARQGPDLLTLTIGSDIAKSPNTPRPACRGYLHKRTQSGLIKGWRKRWFVLRHDCCLHYYRHKRDEGKQRALSAVKLEGAEVGPDTTLGKPFVFKCCPLSANRVYFFCATSNQEMKRWLKAMQRAVHPITQKHVWVDVTRHNSSLPPLAVKSPECLGLLHQIDKNEDVGVQHYCILKDACLYFYGSIRSTQAQGGVYLHGYTVREQPLGSKKSTIELKPPSDEFKTFYLCAENPSENKRWIAAIKASIAKWLPLHQAIQDYMNRPPEETRM